MRCSTPMVLAVLVAVLAASPAMAQPPSLSDAQISRGLVRYRREPTVQRVVQSALAARSASPGRVRDAMDRARAAGCLPTTSASLRRGQAVDLRALTNGERTNVSTDDDLVLEARVTFRFDRLVFAPEEVGLLRELRAVEAEQAEIARLVVHLYFERRRLQLERDLLNAGDATRVLRILEIEGLLDAFTDGAFNRMMGSRRGGT